MSKTTVDELVANRIRPTGDNLTDQHDGAVRLRLGSEGLSATEPISVPNLLHRTATNFPDVTALMHKDSDNVWQAVTYSQYRENVLRTAKAFIKLGLEPRHSVGILAFNSPEWFYSELGAIHAG